MLYVCDSSAATLQAFQRQFGEAKFVTADEARAATGAWAAPRCITESEFAKLQADDAGLVLAGEVTPRPAPSPWSGV